MVRLDPWGNVYPCLEQHTRIGSVRSENFPTLWNSRVFNDVRKSLSGKDGECRCWYNNTALISHYAMILGRMSAPQLSRGARRFPESEMFQGG